MTATIAIENVTVPGDAIHWGDTIRVVPSGMPNGKNYYTANAYTPSFWGERKSASGDTPVEFVVGGGRPFETSYALDYAECIVYADNDANQSNGIVTSAGFSAQAPR
jgi:hypothetical protein